MARSILAGIGDRLAERRHFASRRSWFWFIYDRLLNRWKRLPLPGRGCVRAISVKGVPTPVHIRLGTTDMRTAEEIFWGGQYDPVVDGRLGTVRTVVDLGANAGYSLLLWQTRFPGCRVVAVEPDKANMAVCKRNAASKGAASFVEVCVAGSRRKVALDRTHGEWGYEMRELITNGADDRAASPDTIDALPLEQILAQAGPGWDGPIDLLKCNIEGAEAELFAGAPPWIARVRCAVVDVHKPYTAQQMLADFRAADGRDWRIQRLDGNDHREMILAMPSERT